MAARSRPVARVSSYDAGRPQPRRALPGPPGAVQPADNALGVARGGQGARPAARPAGGGLGGDRLRGVVAVRASVGRESARRDGLSRRPSANGSCRPSPMRSCATMRENAQQIGRAGRQNIRCWQRRSARRWSGNRMTDQKRCPDCRRALPLSEFLRNAASPDGHQRYCRHCRQRRLEAQRARKGRPATKRCSRCHRELPRSEFWGDRSRSDGLQRECKECHRAARQEYRHEYANGYGRPKKADKRSNPARRRVSRQERIDGSLMALQAQIAVCRRRLAKGGPWRAQLAFLCELAEARVRGRRLTEIRERLEGRRGGRLAGS